MKQIIIAMSGRKGAGKNTIATFIQQWYCKRFTPASLLESYDFIPIDSKCYECSFADNLKQFCIDVLGLDENQCYGSDEEKNTPTKYLWDDAPEFFRWKFSDRLLKWGDSVKKFEEINNIESFYNHIHRKYLELIPETLRTGTMNSREVMQIYGTECVREVFGNVWADATIRSIKKMGKPLSVITDNRFPDEIESVLSEPNGYIIRLTRSPFGIEDLHPSEASLDNFAWQRDRCYTLNNDIMTIEEQNEEIVPILKDICAKGANK